MYVCLCFEGAETCGDPKVVPRIEVQPTWDGDRDGVSLTDAFRLARIAAGWDRRVRNPDGSWFPPRGLPVGSEEERASRG